MMNRLRRHRKEKANRNDIVHNEKGSTTTIISSLAAGRNTSRNDSNLLLPESQGSSHQPDFQPVPQPASQPAQPNKGSPAPKISDFDLANALPPPEDFRTSLLMPKLSARFSMLKEQDNPQSMMGKASDDSVLFPKRASRLNLFGHPPSLLADIEEMSIHSGHQGRVDSYASGDTTDDDRSQAGSSSIMSRARRAEGNNLFGGRQKVYKIPTKPSSPGGVSPNPSEGSGRSRLGRPVYEHDVIPSSFTTRRQGLHARDDHAGEDASLDTSPVSPMEDVFSSMGGSNRTTATTVDEQLAPSSSLPPSSATGDKNLGVKPLFPERGGGGNRSRRLYGQGLAQSVQNQQHSTLNRLENLSRRPATPEHHPQPAMSRGYSRSATSLRDRLHKLGVDQIPSSRPTSPPLSSASPQPTPVEEDAPNEPAPAAPAPAPAPAPTAAAATSSSVGPPPLSPPISEVEDEEKKLQLQQQWPQPLAAALQPEDHGKATAAGLFNKPRAPFDESQFTRRQLQMHEGRNTPPLRRPPSPPRRGAPQQPEPMGRPARGLSNASSYRSRPGSASSQYSELQQKHSNAAGTRSRSSSVNQPMGTTFFANSSPSDSGDEYEEDEVRSSMDDDDIHPALRSRTPSKPATPTHDPQDRQPLSEVRFFDLNDLNPIAEHDSESGANSDVNYEEQRERNDDEDPESQEADSPTLGPSGPGLSGLVRTHLRQDSDSALSPRLPPSKFNPDTAEPADAPSESTISAPSSESNEDENVQDDPRVSAAESFYPDEHEHEPEPEPEDKDVAESKRYMHQRNGSTETQREREEFANELAERRKRVQEKLQGFDSRSASRAGSLAGSRSGSPVGRQTPDGVKPGNAFALLRNRNAGGKNPLFSKASGGLGNNSNNSSSPSLFLDRDDPWREEDERSFNPNAGNSHLAERPSVRSRVAAIARNNSQEGSRESSRGRGVSPVSSIVSGLRSRRDRSQSDASTRSKSRSRRDDLRTVEEGSVISHDTIMLPGLSYDPSGNGSVPSTRRQSLDMVSEADSSADATPVEPPSEPPMLSSNRYRSSSRSGSSGFFFDDLPPPGPPPAMIGASSPRPSPIAPYSANATPPLHEITPDPTSPPAPTFAAAASHVVPQRAPGHTGLAKRTVNKTLISEPTFVSSTSNVPTVGLPPGANLNNGREQTPSPVQAPAVPPMNPRRRRQTTTQTIMGAFKGDSSRHDEPLPPPMDRSNTSNSNPSVTSGAGSSGRGTPDDRERSVFESDSKRSISRSRLRKTSSEGTSLAGTPPAPPPAYPPPKVPDMDGRMF